MDIYRSLLEIIDPTHLPELQKLYQNEDSLLGKILSDLLNNPDITGEEMLEKYDVSEGTLNKTLTYVKDILWDFNARHIQTTFDDIFVLRQMLFKGNTKNALKFYNALEKKFELTQQWDKLDCLYIEGLRYAQITGNESMASEVSKQRKMNSKRLHEYTLIYSEIIPEMIRLEGSRFKRFEDSYAERIENLYDRSIAISHHLLIHNSLHIKYLLYSRFRNIPEEVFKIVSDIKDNADKYKQSMAPITYSIALNAYVNFLTIYRHFGSPEDHIKTLGKIIFHGGNIARVNLCYSMLEYALFERKSTLIEYWLKELNDVEGDSKFAQYHYAVNAIKAFSEGNMKAFQKHFLMFYSDPSHLNFPDVQITLRILEAIDLVMKKEGDLAFARLAALRIFIARNVDKERYKDERKILAVLNKINESRKDFDLEIKLLEDSPYRNIYFITSIIKERLFKF